MDRPATPPSRPILLVGLPGAGKSTIAPLLAAALGLPSHDSDALIEAVHGQSLPDLFRAQGEAAFRSEERRVVANLLAGPAAVIATGGGAWLDPEIRAVASERALTLWLDADLETLVRRLGGARGRPLLAGDVRARLAALKAIRDPIYGRAHIHVDATSTPASVVAAIRTSLAEIVR